MKTLTYMAGVSALAIVGAAQAELVFESGWEDTSAPALLGFYGNMSEYGYDAVDPYAGDHSLYMQEDPLSGTPQGYVAWIHGLVAGDTVTVGIWAKGQDTGGTNSRGRLWGHYTQDDDINVYEGSAGGGSDTAYIGEGGVWTYGETTFTFDGEEGTALVIEARVYAYSDNRQVNYDNMTVTISNDGASADIAGVPAPGALALLGLGGLVARRRRG